MTSEPEVDEQTLDQLQRGAFAYFEQAMNPKNGLVLDTSREDSPVSIAVVGFALSSYPVAVERGWIARTGAVTRCLSVLRFLRDSDQSGSPEATGFKGFYYHFLDARTGTRVWGSELSMVDSALLIAGALTASGYFALNSADEIELREIVDTLYRRIDWRWAQGSGPTIRHGWKPESGFLNYAWDGYSEAMVLYILALGSPTYFVEGQSYLAWTATYQWEHLYGYDFLYAGPLFVHQFSHAWIDFRGIKDRFMRERGCDYFENSRRATLVQREYARRNPHRFIGYGENCWGFTACDGPDYEVGKSADARGRLFGYTARGVPYGPDDGTIAPWAAIGSLPFAADIAWRAVRHMLERYPEILSANRYSSSFNPTLGSAEGGAWVSAGHFGLDQGVVVMMIENYRTQLIWGLMRKCPYVAAGLRRAGFRGGWL